MVLISPAVYLRKGKTSLSHDLSMQPIFFAFFCTKTYVTQSSLQSYYHSVCLFVYFVLYYLFTCMMNKVE